MRGGLYAACNVWAISAHEIYKVTAKSAHRDVAGAQLLEQPPTHYRDG